MANRWGNTGNSSWLYFFSSVQFSLSVMPDSLRPRELQHARPPCPSPTPRVHSNSHPYMTTGKTIALIRWTVVGKVTSLLFNLLSRLVITFLPRSKCLLISWLQSPSAVILEPKKINSDTVSTVYPSICHEAMGPDAMILVSEWWTLSQLFHSPLSLSSRGFWVLHFLP